MKATEAVSVFARVGGVRVDRRFAVGEEVPDEYVDAGLVTAVEAPAVKKKAAKKKAAGG